MTKPRCGTGASRPSRHRKGLSIYGFDDYTQIRHIMTYIGA